MIIVFIDNETDFISIDGELYCELCDMERWHNGFIGHAEFVKIDGNHAYRFYKRIYDENLEYGKVVKELEDVENKLYSRIYRLFHRNEVDELMDKVSQLHKRLNELRKESLMRIYEQFKEMCGNGKIENIKIDGEMLCEGYYCPGC